MMFRIMRLMTGVVAAALRGLRGRANPKYDVAWPAVVPPTGTCCPARQPWPNPGDEVEAWSAHADAWFPAVVAAAEADPWGPIAVRLKGNAPGALDRLRRDLVRPLRRLAAARRECGPSVDYDAYDRDNVRHIEECTGCRGCAGVGQYYTQCRKCGRTKHREFLDGTRHCGHETGEDGLCWFCLPTWPYTRNHARLARERACASRV